MQHSRLAVALADAILRPPDGQATPISDELFAQMTDRVAEVIDARLADTRKHYTPEALARCPYVCPHPDPCAACVTAAMRDFILIPEDADATTKT